METVMIHDGVDTIRMDNIILVLLVNAGCCQMKLRALGWFTMDPGWWLIKYTLVYDQLSLMYRWLIFGCRWLWYPRSLWRSIRSLWSSWSSWSVVSGVVDGNGDNSAKLLDGSHLLQQLKHQNWLVTWTQWTYSCEAIDVLQRLKSSWSRRYIHAVLASKSC